MKIAILGAGSIARSMCRTIRGMKEAGRPVELYAVASRDIDKAVRFAREQDVRRAYGSYEQLLQDPAVELVYIATPHSHHYEQMKLCIAHGKPVLCEKALPPMPRRRRRCWHWPKSAAYTLPKPSGRAICPPAGSSTI